MIIPSEYILQKFYQYAGYPKHKKTSNTYIAGCPICHEGTSWGKKRRCIYLVEKNIICCHNCGWYSDSVKWVQEVSGMTFAEIVGEAKNYDILPLDVLAEADKPAQKKPQEKLPFDSINLFDNNQLNYYEHDKVVQDALELVKHRRIDKAINRPECLYVTSKDRIHKNRIIIPFYGLNNDIIFYQSRCIYSSDLKHYPKYLSKVNGEKSMYNINKISEDLEYIFIFEGPIDSFFVQNGTAVAGIQENSETMFTKLQEEQLNAFKFYKRIWVLDNQRVDKASSIKTKKLVDAGETVFIWPENLGKQYKDINDFCIDKKINQVEPSFFIKNSYDSLKAKLITATICR